MAMMTQLTDDTDTLVPLRWGYWHLDCLHKAMVSETGIKEHPYFPGEYLFTEEHAFTDESDGEIFPIHPGYIYRTWRE